MFPRGFWTQGHLVPASVGIRPPSPAAPLDGGILSRVRRVSVVGNSGSGKSTRGACGGRVAGRPVRRAGRALPPAGLAAASSGRVRRGWSTAVRPATGGWSTATTPTPSTSCGRARTRSSGSTCRGALVMRQVVGRTARRVLRREELWNGNRERLRSALEPRPRASRSSGGPGPGTPSTPSASPAGRPTRAGRHLEVVRLRSTERRRGVPGIAGPASGFVMSRRKHPKKGCRVTRRH